VPYDIGWYIENEIIYIRYSGVTTPDELRESLVMVQDMIEGSHRSLVHVIGDVGEVTQAVPTKDTLGIVRQVGSHDRSGWNIILREQSVLVKMSAALGMSIFKTRNRMFDTLEEAEAFLKEMDTTLNWDRVDRSIIAG
jgi:hypothetical protein